jgi:hypothetical protein
MVQRRYVITPPGFCPHVIGTTITELSREAHLLAPFRRVLLGNGLPTNDVLGNSEGYKGIKGPGLLAFHILGWEKKERGYLVEY